MRLAITLLTLLLLLPGCGSAWMTLPSAHVYLADSQGPVALYFASSDDGAVAGLHCVDLTTKRQRWALPGVFASQLFFSRSRSFFYLPSGDQGVRFFRTSDGHELGSFTRDALGSYYPGSVEHYVTIAADGRHIAAAGPRQQDRPALLRLIPVPRGKARDLTFGEGYGVRDLAFGPPGWLVARGDDRRRTIYAYDDAGWRKTRDVVATQAWWAADRVVFVSPEGQLGTLMLDGTRYDTPRITLGPDAAKTLDDHPERVHLGADGHHLIYDGGDHVVLLRLADGAELYRSSANGHRGSNYEAIHGAFLTATTAGIAYTANADYEGRLAIINLRTGTATTRSLGRLGSYGGGLAGFDISPSFDWRMRPLLSPRGEFLVLVRDDDALVQVLGARGATKSVARVSMATQL